MSERDDAIFRAITRHVQLRPPEFIRPEDVVRTRVSWPEDLGFLAALIGLYFLTALLHLHGAWAGVRYTLTALLVIETVHDLSRDIRKRYFIHGVYCPHCRHQLDAWEIR